MGTECVSGFKFKEGDQIKGYRIVKAFDPGANAFAGKAQAQDGRTVFFKKYKRPGAAAQWYDGYVAYQQELKKRIGDNTATKKLCYEFIEFFELKGPKGPVPRRAFYQVFEWVEGMDLRKVIDKIRNDPRSFDWKKRVVFARVMMATINALHRAGVVHTDLKPENFYLIKMDDTYAVRVIDLDYSLIEGRKAPWHGHEGYVGTPGYMSPEHLKNVVPQKSSDVFTAGLILGELLGGGHPAGHNMDAYDALVKDGRLGPIVFQQPIAEAPDGDFLAHVINATLRPEAAKRPSAEQVMRALRGQLTDFDGKRPASGGSVTVPGADPVRSHASPPSSRVEERPAPPARPAPVETPKPPQPAKAGGIEISGPGDRRLVVNIGAKFGRSHFKAWDPDFEKFMAGEQFQLQKDASGKWMISHCPGATNQTTADGNPIAAPVPVASGMVVALGKTGKCRLTLKLK